MFTLAEILESTPSSNLLAFLLLAPPRGYSRKELHKRLHIPDKTIQSMLKEFIKYSLVKSFSRDKQFFYLINEKHKLLPEIKQSLIKNQRPYEDELLTAIKKIGEVKAAFLSGVFTGQPQLPVDLLVVGKVNLKKLDTFLSNCKSMMGVDINYSIMTPDEFQMRRDTFDRFLKDIFDYPHIVAMDNLKNRSKRGGKK